MTMVKDTDVRGMQHCGTTALRVLPETWPPHSGLSRWSRRPPFAQGMAERGGPRRRRSAQVVVGRITLIVLAVLPHDQRLADMAGPSQVSASTVRRWLLEVMHLLAARAERLARALNEIVKRGGAVVLIDGT